MITTAAEDAESPTTEDMAEQFVAGAMVTGFAYSRDEARGDWNRWLADLLTRPLPSREAVARVLADWVIPGVPPEVVADAVLALLRGER